jgi:transcriptional regulator with XRE-family HTH domain
VNILNYEVVQRLREQKGWDQSRVAKIAGINRSVISPVERGLQTDLRLSVALAIANALNVSVEALLAPTVGVKRPLEPELEAILTDVSKLSEESQRQVAGILRGYLSTIKEK